MTYEKVEAEDWSLWIEQNDGVVIDVREPPEWELGTLPGARLIPMSEIADRLDELPSGPLLLVCRSGGRSRRVAQYLGSKGWDRTANMEGGMKALGLQE